MLTSFVCNDLLLRSFKVKEKSIGGWEAMGTEDFGDMFSLLFLLKVLSCCKFKPVFRTRGVGKVVIYFK